MAIRFASDDSRLGKLRGLLCYSRRYGLRLLLGGGRTVRVDVDEYSGGLCRLSIAGAYPMLALLEWGKLDSLPFCD